MYINIVYMLNNTKIEKNSWSFGVLLFQDLGFFFFGVWLCKIFACLYIYELCVCRAYGDQ